MNKDLEKESNEDDLPLIIGGIIVVSLFAYLFFDFQNRMPGNFHDWAEAMAAIATIIAVAAVYQEYNKANRQKRQEWVSKLHERFYANGSYSEVRKILDWSFPEDKDIRTIKRSCEEEMKGIKNGIYTDAEMILVEKFHDYLNFFLYISVLWKDKFLSDEDICQYFKYYLNILSRYKFIIDYISDEEQNFKPVEKLITRFDKEHK